MKKVYKQITFKQAQKLNYQNVTIKMTEDGLEYYIEIEPIYELWFWKNDNEEEVNYFKSSQQAHKYARIHNYSNYDIKKRLGTNLIYIKHYEDGELTDEIL